MTNDEVAVANSRPLLEFIEETATLGTWVWEIDKDEFHWSRQMFTITGLDPATVKPSFELYMKVVHPDDQLDFSKRAGVLRSGQLDEREFRVIRPNGTIRWVKSYGRMLHHPDGAPWKMVGFAQDVTEKRAHRIGHAAHAALGATVFALTDALVWLASPDGSQIDQADWWVATRYGGKPGINWSRMDIVHPDDLGNVRAAWSRALAENRSYHVSFRGQVGGVYERFVSHAEPVHDAQRGLVGWIGLTMRERGESHEPAAATNIPGPLIRAARAYLGYSVQKLAEVSRLSSSTIRRMEEGGAGQVTRDSEDTLVRAFRNAGINFYVDRTGLTQLHIGVAS